MEFDDRIYRQIIGIPMGTNCAPLIADLFLYCHEKEFMDRLVTGKQFDLIECFNRTSRYLDDILNLDNPNFEKCISDIYPKELCLTKCNTSDTHTPFLAHLAKASVSLWHDAAYVCACVRPCVRACVC